MPELFEVKRIKEYLLDASILRTQISSVCFKNCGERILKHSDIDSFYNLLINNYIESIQTKAKYTLLCLKKGSILLHYRFTGIPHVEGFPYGDRLKSIYNLPIVNLNSSHIRFSISFSNGKELNYYDTRCLSHMHIDSSNQSFSHYTHLSNLSDDMLTHNMLSYSDFKDTYFHLKCDLKSFLLDQTKPPSGIGNYLANEICAHSNLSPWIKIFEINETQYEQLIFGIKSVINCCESDTFYQWFRVFNQEFCKICNHKIIKVKHKKGAQSTFYCEFCQG